MAALLAACLVILALAPAAPAAARTDPDQSERLTRAGRLADTGKPAEARAVLLDLLKQDPNNQAAADRLTAVLVRTRENASAVNDLEALLAEHPDWPALLGVLARVHEANQRREDSIRILARALRLGSDQPGLYYRFVASTRTAWEKEFGDGLIDSLLEARPEQPAVLYAQGVRSWMDRDLDGAERWLRLALDLDPGYPDIWLSLGNVEQQSYGLPTAQATWEEGLQVLRSLGNDRGAFELLERLITSGWKGATAEAVQTAQEGISLAEGLGELERADRIRTRLFQVQKELGWFDEMTATGMYRAAQALEQADTLEAFRRITALGAQLHSLGALWQAAGVLETALDFYPPRPGGQLGFPVAAELAQVWLGLGRISQAEAWAGAVLDSSAQESSLSASMQAARLQAHLSLAHVSTLNGDAEEAASRYEELLATPSGGDVLRIRAEAGAALTRLLRDQGRLPESRAALERITREWSRSRSAALTVLLDLEGLELLAAEERWTDLVREAARIRETMPPADLPGARSRLAALSAGALLEAKKPGQALAELLDSWTEAESLGAESGPTPLPPFLTPDPEESLEQLALFFARIALRPGEAPARVWQGAEDTSHRPEGAEALLAARWSFFFAQRRAQRAQERLLVDSGIRRPVDPFVRAPVWEAAAAQCRADFRLLEGGGSVQERGAGRLFAIPDEALEDLQATARAWGSLGWCLCPAEDQVLQETLAARGEAYLQAAVFRERTILYLIQGDRIRLDPAEMSRHELARRVRDWQPFTRGGCADPFLESLPTDFGPAERLFSTLLGPAGESIDLRHTLWICADGPLWSLAWESLAPLGGKGSLGPDGILFQDIADIPLALDRYRIAYVLGAGALCKPPERFGHPLEDSPDAYPLLVVRIVEADQSSHDIPAHRTCLKTAPAHPSVWSLPPCGVAAEELEAAAETAGARRIQVSGDSVVDSLGCGPLGVMHLPLLDGIGEPRAAGFFLGTPASPWEQADRGVLLWADWAKRLRGRGLLALTQAGACGSDGLSPALNPALWGSEVVLPALAATAAGHGNLYQPLWNSGEGNWIPLDAMMRSGRFDLDAFQTARLDLRGAEITAGHGHRVALGHPFFSCSARWWRLSPL